MVEVNHTGEEIVPEPIAKRMKHVAMTTLKDLYVYQTIDNIILC